jgi:succinylglutamate desuccinylase
MSILQRQVDFAQFRQTGDFLGLTLSAPDGHAPATFVLADGTKAALWDSGILCLEPETPGEWDIVLSCGIHGNETAPIELVADLTRQILQGELQLKQRLLVLIGNPPAINAGKRELQDNLNRLFSGHHSKDGLDSAERRRARLLEDCVSRFYAGGDALGSSRQRALYDLHTAIRGSQYEKFAVYPFLHGKPWSASQLHLLKACAVTTFLLMQTPASTFSYYASNSHGAHAFTLELGKVRPFGENDMSRFAACADTLAKLISGSWQHSDDVNEADFNFFAVNRSINKQHADFTLCFARNIENFTSFAVGTVIARDGGQDICIETEGEAVIFPNADVALGQRAMLLVKPVSVSGQLA